MNQPLINISRKQALLFALFFVLYEFLTYIANDMIMPGMLQVVDTFHAPISAVASSLTAYLLGGASLQLILGPISDRYGRRPVMIVGACFFCLATTLIACSQSIDQFLLFRLFEGMGLCFIFVIGYATLQEIFEEMDAVRLIAAMTNVSVTAPLLGPLLGVWFLSYLSWRMIFLLIAALALISLWGIWRFMPEPVGQTTRFGHVIHPAPFSFPVILNNYKRLFCNKGFIIGSLAGGLLGLPCVVWIALSPVMIVTRANLSMFEYGLWQLPIFGTFIAGNVCLQYLTHKTTLIKMMGWGSVLAFLSLLLTGILPVCFDRQFIWLVPGLVGYFFGYGLAYAPLNRYILFATPVSKGTAAALMSMIAMCVQALGIEIGNDLYVVFGNVFFGLYCALLGVMYVALVAWLLYLNQRAGRDFGVSRP